MTFRMALRSFAAQPIRSGVLACGFGLGIACMAGLLGVGEVILEQSRSPYLRGGGDLAVYGTGGKVSSARFITSQLFSSPSLKGRAVTASPSLDATLYLVEEGHPPLAVHAIGGIPSLERDLDDPETSELDVWQDEPADRAWASPDPGDVIRAMDRFHAIPDVPSRADSWAEWMYFNGRAGDVRFYLSFMVGPGTGPDLRSAGVQLQLEQAGRTFRFVDRAEISERELLDSAPDLRIGACSVRLDGLRYRIGLSLARQGRDRSSGVPDLTGEITLDAVPGRSLPPFEITGAGGWLSGYVVPVLSGALNGSLQVEGRRVSLEGGTGYHDHNWGFWEGVTWQWGQVAGDDVSVVYGRIRPPVDAADAERVPGFLMVLDAEGPLGYSTDVTIEERDDTSTGLPVTIHVIAEADTLSLDLALTIEDTTVTDLANDARGEFLQLRARFVVSGQVGSRRISFAAPGSAETFRGS